MLKPFLYPFPSKKKKKLCHGHFLPGLHTLLDHSLLLICCFYCCCIIWRHSASSAQPLSSFLNAALTQSWVANLAKWATSLVPQTIRSPEFSTFAVCRFLCDNLIHFQFVFNTVCTTKFRCYVFDRSLCKHAVLAYSSCLLKCAIL